MSHVTLVEVYDPRCDQAMTVITDTRPAHRVAERLRLAAAPTSPTAGCHTTVVVRTIHHEHARYVCPGRHWADIAAIIRDQLGDR